MSETLSYQEAPQEGLNQAEQEALQVGEQMEQEQQQLLAGKYKSTEELEKAYVELQKKIGSQDERGEAVEEDTQQDSQESESETESQKEDSSSEVLTDADVEYLHNLAGGEKGYQAMLKWAADTLNQKEIEMYDSVMDSGDPNSIYFAVQSMVSKYNEATGSEGKLLTGKSSSSDSSVFRSQQELVAAMSDPRYDNDPAYRQDVIDQLARSDLQF